jgi:hypothetical protein
MSLPCLQVSATGPCQVSNVQFYYFKIHINAIHPSTPRPSKWTVPFKIQTEIV